MLRLLRLAAAGFLATLVFSTPNAGAAELKAQLQSCTAADCGATVLFGRLNKSERCCGFANFPMPWVVQLFANKNECLRLRIMAQPADTEIVAVAPGTQRTFRNDNSGIAPCPTCGLLKIRTNANEEGWFLVQVNQTSGTPAIGEFQLRYARYPVGNPNCTAPSAPLPVPPQVEP